jgi:hypothetical protein
LAAEPLLGLALLADRTVAIAAAAWCYMGLGAVLALIQDRATRLAFLQSMIASMTRWWDAGIISPNFSPIRRGVPPQNLLDGAHLTDPP